MEAAQSIVGETKEGRLTRFATSMDKHNGEIEELSQQLGRLIDRLQGPRPTDASDEDQPPKSQNIMDRIESTLTDASCGLSSIATKMNQLDELL